MIKINANSVNSLYNQMPWITSVAFVNLKNSSAIKINTKPTIKLKVNHFHKLLILFMVYVKRCGKFLKYNIILSIMFTPTIQYISIYYLLNQQ